MSEIPNRDVELHVVQPRRVGGRDGDLVAVLTSTSRNVTVVQPSPAVGVEIDRRSLASHFERKPDWRSCSAKSRSSMSYRPRTTPNMARQSRVRIAAASRGPRGRTLRRCDAVRSLRSSTS